MSATAQYRRSVELLLSPQETDIFRVHINTCDDLHAFDAAGNSLLHWAAALGNVDGANALLQRGLDVHALNALGSTPLVVAMALCPNPAAMGWLLLSHGATLEEKAQTMLTKRKMDNVVKWLLDYGSTILTGDPRGLGSIRGSNKMPIRSPYMEMALCSAAELAKLCRRHDTEENAVAAAAPGRGEEKTTSRSKMLLPEPEQTRLLSPLLISSPTAAEPSWAVLKIALAVHEIASQIAVFFSEEKEHRLRLEMQWMQFAVVELVPIRLALALRAEAGTCSEVSLLASTPPEKPVFRLPAPVRAVLGERMDEKNQRYLLVECHEPQDGAGDKVTWRRVEVIASDPVVRAYLERNFTASTALDGDGATEDPLVATLRSPFSALDPLERQQMEEQLRRIPRRILSSPDEITSLGSDFAFRRELLSASKLQDMRDVGAHSAVEAKLMDRLAAMEAKTVLPSGANQLTCIPTPPPTIASPVPTPNASNPLLPSVLLPHTGGSNCDSDHGEPPMPSDVYCGVAISCSSSSIDARLSKRPSVECYCLSTSQKEKYNQFLYESALRIVVQQHGSGGSPGAAQ